MTKEFNGHAEKSANAMRDLESLRMKLQLQYIYICPPHPNQRFECDTTVNAKQLSFVVYCLLICSALQSVGINLHIFLSGLNIISDFIGQFCKLVDLYHKVPFRF